MTATKKILALVVAVLMILAILPVASIASNVSASAAEAKKLALLDEAWEGIEKVEAEVKAKKATAAEITKAAYNAALNDPLVDEGSLVWESDIQFAFTVDGMHCLYYYTARNAQDSSVKGEKTVVSFGTRAVNAAGSANVLLVGPYYGQDSSFTDQYKTEAASIAETTGGSLTSLVSSAATGPAIAENYTDKGVVIYDSHGTQSGTSSYLCLTTNTGITSTDYNNGWAVSSGSAAYIDGRYIQNHISGTLSNCLVWMAICQGMKSNGYGTTGTALLAAGAGCVYGYSQSVSFTGDYEYEEHFWNNMKNNDTTVAEAFAAMTSSLGNWDPAYSSSSGAAWPIVMSPTDSFPANPDSHQTVTCDWKLLGGEPVALESFEIANSSGDVITSATVRQGKTLNLKIAATPTNANDYTAVWSTGDSSVASVSSNSTGKTATVTGVTAGTTTVTATVTTEGGSVYTKSVQLTVTEAPQWIPTSTIVPGEEYLIGFVVDGVTYLAVNYNVTSGDYYNSISANYYGYTAPATMNGSNVIGVSGNASDIDYCTWIFGTSSGGVITSGYESGRYLQAYSNTNYADLYPGTSSSYTWTFDASAKTLYTTVSSTARYAQYYTTGSANLMGVTSSVPTNGYVQLFSMSAEPAEPTPEPTEDPTVYYTVTFVDWNGSVLKTQQVAEGASATAPSAPSRPGYTFTGWDVDFTNVTSNLTVTAQYEALPVGETVWAPTDTITLGEEYLIGFVVDGVTYLAVNFNVNAEQAYQHYTNISSTYYGYTAPASMNGEYVVGVSGNASDLQYCTWIFGTSTSASGYTIMSGYEEGCYLVTWSSAVYDDLHPNSTTTVYAWNWDASNHTLYRTISSTNRYAQYYTTNGGNYMRVSSTAPTNAYVQLFHQVSVEPTDPTYYDVTFVDGLTNETIATVTTEEGTAAAAPTAPVHEGYTFDGWDKDFSNVTSDLTVTAQYSINSYTLTVNYVDEDGNAVADAYTGTYTYGAAYSVASPEVEGYTAGQATVTGTMGAQNVTVTVTYTKNDTPVTGLIGDANCDGTVDFADAAAIAAYVMTGTGLSAQGILNADVNGQGGVTAADITALYNILFA